MSVRAKIAVLISGRGSNLQALQAASALPNYPAEIALVISNVATAPGLDWAKARGLTTLVLNHRDYASREAYDQAVDAAIRAAGASYVCLAGFMRVLSGWFVQQWAGRLLNIHPSLLPAFPGLHVHEQVIASGAKFSGCTVHWVNEGVDTGGIIAQAVVPVLPTDDAASLAARVLQAEHQLYPAALAWVLGGAATLSAQNSVAYTPALRHCETIVFNPALPNI